MKTYLAIDFGTTNVKAALFDGSGGVRKLLRQPTPAREDSVGSIYDPAEVRELLRGFLRELEGEERPGGIVVTGMAEAGLMLDRRTGDCLSPIIPWFDQRTAAYAARMTPEEDRERFRTTGLRNSFKYGIYKYRWCLDHSGMAAEGTVWLSAVDFLVYLLTGEYATDPTFAARTYGYSLETGDFDLPWLAKWGMTRENFPRLVPSGGWIGNCILPGWEGIPVHIGAHDHICAAYGMGLSDLEAICNSCGTAETYTGTLPRRPLTGEDFDNGYVFGPFPGENRLFWMANISSSGMAVEWYRKKLQTAQLSYADLENALAWPNPTGILFLPALSGMGTPCFRQDLRGAFLNLGLEQDGMDLYKAVVEGVCLQGRMILEPALKTGARGILSVGGAAQSPGWMQLKADILGCPVTVLSQPEATLVGAAALMLAAMAGRNTAMDFVRGQEGRTYQPDPEVHCQYAEIYRRYRDGYRLLLACTEDPERRSL